MTLLTLTALLLGQLSPAPKIWDHPVRPSLPFLHFDYAYLNVGESAWGLFESKNYPNKPVKPTDVSCTITTKDGKHWHAVWVEDKK